MALTSWIASANDPASDFPIQNLPYGVFLHAGCQHIGVAIGDQILDLHACEHAGLIAALSSDLLATCRAEWGSILSWLSGPRRWSELPQPPHRHGPAPTPTHPLAKRVAPCLVPMRDAQMQLPAQIGDYTDFYASIYHARRVGALFRPDSPLLPQLQAHPHRVPRPQFVHCRKRNGYPPPLGPNQISLRQSGLRPMPLARLRT